MTDWEKRLAVHDTVAMRIDFSDLERRVTKMMKRFPIGWGWAPRKHRRKRLAKKLQRRGNMRVIAKGPPDKKWLRKSKLSMELPFPWSPTGRWSRSIPPPPPPPPIYNFYVRPGHTGLRDLFSKDK